MTRYLRQRDTFTCGPVSIINAIKWSGRLATERTYKKRFKTELQCEYPDGTPYDWKMGLVLRKYFSYVKVISRPKINDIDNALDNNQAILLRYFHDEYFSTEGRIGHYTLCIKNNNKRNMYTFVNDSRRKAVVRRTRNTVKEMLALTFDGDTSLAWILSKEYYEK